MNGILAAGLFRLISDLASQAAEALEEDDEQAALDAVEHIEDFVEMLRREFQRAHRKKTKHHPQGLSPSA